MSDLGFGVVLGCCESSAPSSPRKPKPEKPCTRLGRCDHRPAADLSGATRVVCLSEPVVVIFRLWVYRRVPHSV